MHAGTFWHLGTRMDEYNAMGKVSCKLPIAVTVLHKRKDGAKQ